MCLNIIFFSPHFFIHCEDNYVLRNMIVSLFFSFYLILFYFKTALILQLCERRLKVDLIMTTRYEAECCTVVTCLLHSRMRYVYFFVNTD